MPPRLSFCYRDVYKRQVNALRIEALDGSVLYVDDVFAAESDGVLAIEDRTQTDVAVYVPEVIESQVLSVSYTHLDVYKRQVAYQ